MSRDKEHLKSVIMKKIKFIENNYRSVGNKQDLLKLYLNFCKESSGATLKDNEIILNKMIFDKTTSNLNIGSSKKEKELIRFYSVGPNKTVKELLKGKDILRLKISSREDILEKLKGESTVFRESNQVPKELVRPVINKAVMVIEEDDTTTWMQFNIKSEQLLVDIYIEKPESMVIDPQSKYTRGNLINIANCVFEMSKDVEDRAKIVLVGAFNKLSYKGINRLLSKEDLNLSELQRLNIMTESLITKIWDRAAVSVENFIVLNALIRLILLKNKNESKDTLTNTSKVGREGLIKEDGSKSEQTSNGKNSTSEVVIDLRGETMDECKKEISSELKKSDFVSLEWTVRGHYRKYKSGKVIYVEPQTRKRGSHLIVNNSKVKNKNKSYKVFV